MSQTASARCITSTNPPPLRSFDSEQWLHQMRIADLPYVVFVGDRGSRKLELAKHGRQIAHLSDLLKLRMPSARRIGILFRSTPELVLYWLAALDSGKTPLIMQYPTKKLSIDYWQTTLLNTIDSLKIDGLVCGPEMRA